MCVCVLTCVRKKLHHEFATVTRMLPNLCRLHALCSTGMGTNQAESGGSDDPPNVPPGEVPPDPMDQVLGGGEPGLVELILAMSAAGRANDDTAIEKACIAISNWLSVNRAANSLNQEQAIWKRLIETMFPDVPAPPTGTFYSAMPLRERFIELCGRYRTYLARKREYEQKQEEAANAQQDAFYALRRLTTAPRPEERSNDPTYAAYYAQLTLQVARTRYRVSETTEAVNSWRSALEEAKANTHTWSPQVRPVQRQNASAAPRNPDHP